MKIKTFTDKFNDPLKVSMIDGDKGVALWGTNRITDDDEATWHFTPDDARRLAKQLIKAARKSDALYNTNTAKDT